MHTETLQNSVPVERYWGNKTSLRICLLIYCSIWNVMDVICALRFGYQLSITKQLHLDNISIRGIIISGVKHFDLSNFQSYYRKKLRAKKLFHKNDASLKTAFLRLYLGNLTPRQNPLTSGRQKCCDQVGNNMT